MSKKGQEIDLSTDQLGSAADEFYEALTRAHTGLTRAQSDALNARILLTMVNQVGDIEIIKAAIDRARRDLPGES